MTPLALCLILASAAAHATWNFLAKRAGGDHTFSWLFAALSTVIYAPIALWLVISQRPQVGALGVLFIFGSAVLNTVYYGVLQKGYQVGDLSIVYPLARGSSPLIAIAVAVGFMGERITPVALVGVALITVGTFALLGGTNLRSNMNARAAVGYGLLTGVVIAAFTLWDRHAVSALLVPPLVFEWGANLGRAVLLTPVAVRNQDTIRQYWQTARLETLGVAVLNPLAYILVLTALTFTPISYVAPAREISIFFTAILGTKILAEGSMMRRLPAAGAMVLGVAALLLGGNGSTPTGLLSADPAQRPRPRAGLCRSTLGRLRA